MTLDPSTSVKFNPEQLRLADTANLPAWRKWGPYLSDRQWGTVREDYSPDGRAWDWFPFTHSHQRAYRWGEDGLAGFSDDRQRLCLALALWNEADPILKERLFGVPNEQGNHGEDVKELYFHLDATPSHSYLKMLYKYPQRAFPYAQLVDENRRRGRHEPEFELLETDIFAEQRYFDVFVEYAKAGPDDILLRVIAHNRGPDAAPLHLLPTAWFRNSWQWKPHHIKPAISRDGAGHLVLTHRTLGEYQFYADGDFVWLLTENETNPRVFGQPRAGHFKDAFHDAVIRRTPITADTGTKAAAHFRTRIPAGGTVTIRLRLTPARNDDNHAFRDFDAVFAERIREADAFYADLQKEIPNADAKLVQRQAFAGLIWTKQWYHYDVLAWLAGDPGQPPPPASRRQGRNRDWKHLHNAEVISMPDKWEYPWYAAWDVAFHALPFALIDPEFAKEQLLLFTREWYMHPNGQLPAYEWEFGDANPPVHAWATWRVFQIDRKRRGDCGDLLFLERVFHKLLLNFTWWVNRKDAEGRNIFQGGFLGLDNIGVFDRSKPLPTGGFINQADGTAWMAMYALNMLRIALELATHNPAYEDTATKFFEHFLQIAEAISDFDGHGHGLWDDADGFYYDQLTLPDGSRHTLRVRSVVGLIPLFAVETLEPELVDQLPEFKKRLEWFLKHRPNLAKLVSRWQEPGMRERRLLGLLRGSRMKKLLKRALDETEFLSPFGVRSLSKGHLTNPYTLTVNGQPLTVRYTPGESDTGAFGGNSNWRGPVWFPINYLLIESLQKFHHYYGNDFQVEYPTGSGAYLTLNQIATELSKRLCRLFLRDGNGRRAVFGDEPLLQSDPHFRDCVPFYEYFHGDTGQGLGASHQTGWTALVAKLLQPRTPEPPNAACTNLPSQR